MPPPKPIYKYRIYGNNGKAVNKADSSYKVSFPPTSNQDYQDEYNNEFYDSKYRRQNVNKDNLYTFGSYMATQHGIQIKHGDKAMNIWPLMNIDSLVFQEGTFYIPKAYSPLYRTHFTGYPLGNYIYPNQIKNYGIAAFKAENANDTPKPKANLDYKLLYTLPEGYNLRDISYLQDYNILSVFSSGGVRDSIIISTDKGLSWKGLPLPNEKISVFKLSVTDKNKYCIIVSPKTIYRTYILQTQDRGKSWQRMSFFDSLNIRDIIYTNTKTVYALCWANDTVTHIYKSENGGTNWQLLNIQSSLKVYRNMWFTSPETGYLFTLNNRNRTGYLLKTSDGGKTWTESLIPDLIMNSTNYAAGYSGLAESNFQSVKRFGKNTMVFTENDYFLKSFDEGKSWEYVPILEILYSQNELSKNSGNNYSHYQRNTIWESWVDFLDKNHVVIRLNNSIYNLKL